MAKTPESLLRTSKSYRVLTGPSFAAIMNSLAGPQLGDAYPVSFVICLEKGEVVFTSKIVGLESRDVDDTVVYGLRTQIHQRLSKYNPIKPDEVDAIFTVYNTHERCGTVTLSNDAHRFLLRG